MKSIETREAIGKPVVRKYERYGLLGGLAVGLFIGVLISGPHFYEWPAGLSLAVIFGCAAGSAGIGWLAPAIAVGSLAGGGAWGAGHYGAADNSSSGGDGGGSGVGDGGA